MLLSILIPTYNRSTYLLRNLILLSEYVSRGHYHNEIEIIISNNRSTDDTDERVKGFCENNKILKVKYFVQPANIGLKNNAFFVLDKAEYLYVMYLGDDDYIDYLYLESVLTHLNHNSNISSIIPDYVPVNVAGEIIGESRDGNMSSKLYKAGFKNCLLNSWRGHQLSGLVLEKKGLGEACREYEIDNVYLFIFLLSYSCLKGDSLHLTNYPVKVTQPGQAKKDWGYGKDGLLDEVFDNYCKLPVNYFQKSILQLYFYKKQSWRLWMYSALGNREFLVVILNIWSTKNSTVGFKTFFPIMVLMQSLKRLIAR